ncbi:MAG TPA: FecR family protein [Terracidiphilus sp.]|nr:FecR family protein [Terracidiphilus sp.]
MKSNSIKEISATFILGLAVVAVGSLALAPLLAAQDSDPAPSSGARAERLSSIDGHVQVSQGGQILADPAVINTPLMEGSQVVTLDDGRAEIQFEEGSVARITPNSSVTLSVLRPDDGVGGTQIAMDGGLGYFELQAGSGSGHFQIRFGDATVTSSGFTVLRVDLDNAPGELAVFSGNAHLERGGAISVDLHGGESVALNATDPSQFNLAETIEPDSWDQWNSDRDQALNAEEASRTPATQSFPSNANPAWSDLDANGNWYDVPDQGYVWSPYDASNPGWDPYGNGYWMYNPAFGYEWISGDSWGYLPFSCGTWNFYSGFGWGWAPGMGACTPWWGGPTYVINIGIVPPGFLLPRLPRRPPVRMPQKPGGRKGPYPLIVVNKRPPGRPGTMPHERNISSTIGGHVVMPLRPVAPRAVYDHSASPIITHGMPAMPGVRTPERPYTPATPVFGGNRPAPIEPRAPSGGSPHYTPPRPAPAPAPRSAPPPAPHAAPAPAPHASGGGSHH